MLAQLSSRKAWRIMGFVRDSTQGGKDRHTLVSVNLIVLTYVDEQDFITFDDEFNYDAVADIDRDGRQIAHTSLKAMEPQRWMTSKSYKGSLYYVPQNHDHLRRYGVAAFIQQAP